jgi:hypothetical protein
MPPKIKKKTPKQLLAEAEARGAALTLELARRECELGDTISRLAGNVAECKGLILKQDEALARTFDAREVALRIELADAKERIHRLQGEALLGREALAALDTYEGERAQLQRQVAEAVGTREVMEKAHAAESYAQKQAIVSLRAQMEEKFKVRAGSVPPQGAQRSFPPNWPTCPRAPPSQPPLNTFDCARPLVRCRSTWP